MATGSPRGKAHATADPTPTSLLEYAPLVSALVAGGKATFDIASKIADDVQKNKAPLAVQVLASSADGDDYLVLLRLTSFSGHGICVERLESRFPSKVQPTVERDRLDYDHKTTPSRKVTVPVVPALPFRLPPLARQDLRLRLNRKATIAQIHEHRHAKLVVHCDVLGSKDPLPLEINLRLRDDKMADGTFVSDQLSGGA